MSIGWKPYYIATPVCARKLSPGEKIARVEELANSLEYSGAGGKSSKITSSKSKRKFQIMLCCWWNICVFFQSWPKGCFLLFCAAAVPVAKQLIERLVTKKPYLFPERGALSNFALWSRHGEYIYRAALKQQTTSNVYTAHVRRRILCFGNLSKPFPRLYWS